MDEIKSIISDLSHEEVEALELWSRIELASSGNTPLAFAQFYYLLYDREIPKHVSEQWLPALYQAIEEKKGIIIEAFRGSAKTTSLTISWMAFCIGHAPENSHLLVQVSDQIAEDNSSQIADLIKNNPAWKLVFPHVIPDLKLGWGTKGYEVKRTDIDYQEWRKLASKVKGKDPCFIGLGYRSQAVIGKHPTGILLVDDIHDENNTNSAKELEKVRKIVLGTILPTATSNTLVVFIGTPWTENDILAYMKSTGYFLSVKTPVKTGEKFTWPELFTEEQIEKQRRIIGDIEFARMYLLDLESTKGVHLKREWLQKFPSINIDPSWPVLIGVDYASTADSQKGSNRDYFAAAVGRVLPGNAGVVLVDGIRARLSQGEAEMYIKQLAEKYPTTQIVGVEAVGKGEEFYYLLMRSSNMPLAPMHTGRKSKGTRFEKGMAPLFQFGRVFVSDIDNQFINAFRDEWVKWPNGEHDDTLDAVYWMLYAGMPHLFERQQIRKKVKNPFGSLNRS